MKHRHLELLVAAMSLFTLLGSSPAAGQQPEIATAVAFTEGPTVDRDGNVYFSEMVSLRIMKLGANGVLSTFREQSNNANGLLIDPQGRLVACEGAESQRTGVRCHIQAANHTDRLADGQDGCARRQLSRQAARGAKRRHHRRPRSACTSPILAVSPCIGSMRSGQVTRILAAPDIQRPNGIQVSPDDKQLYLIEANNADKGARMIRAYDLRPDGTVANMRVHYNFYPGRSADGMSIDTQGNLYASAGMNQLRGTSETLDTKTGVYVISPQGKLLKFIPIPEDFITNNAFGGPDMKTLYVTAGKTLYKIRTEIAGLPR